MNSVSKKLYTKLDSELGKFQTKCFSLPGIKKDSFRQVFLHQLIDSIRRVEYVYKIGKRGISEASANPKNSIFDPIKAAIYYRNQGNIDESFWLSFLSVYCGKHIRHKWRMSQEIYGSLNRGENWTWERISSNLDEFECWIRSSYRDITQAFGNHRKFESLRPDASRNPAKVIKSYIAWVGDSKSHSELVEKTQQYYGSPNLEFRDLYNSMDMVVSFGRLSKFDYLALIAKLELVQIEPDQAFLSDANKGPLAGAKLLFDGSCHSKTSSIKLERKLSQLHLMLSVGKMGMQVLEDSLCNWQKNPGKYIYFGG